MGDIVLFISRKQYLGQVSHGLCSHYGLFPCWSTTCFNTVRRIYSSVTSLNGLWEILDEVRCEEKLLGQRNKQVSEYQYHYSIAFRRWESGGCWRHLVSNDKLAPDEPFSQRWLKADIRSLKSFSSPVDWIFCSLCVTVDNGSLNPFVCQQRKHILFSGREAIIHPGRSAYQKENGMSPGSDYVSTAFISSFCTRILVQTISRTNLTIPNKASIEFE